MSPEPNFAQVYQCQIRSIKRPAARLPVAEMFAAKSLATQI